MKCYLLGVLFLLISCNGQKKPLVESNNDMPSTTNLELLLQDEHADFVQAETTIIKDQKRLKSFYTKINRTRKPGLPVPTIDFSKEMVIVQCSGEQNRFGLSTLTFDRETDTEIIFNSKLIPGKNAAIAITYPFCLYKMPLTEKAIKVNLIGGQK